MEYPKVFEELVNHFRKLPGVGQKAATRYAYEFLSMSENDAIDFVNSILSVKKNIHFCKKCGYLSEEEFCTICLDDKRDESIICVVQEPKDVIAIEKHQTFNGRYHVLHGVISPSKGILPDDIEIQSLIDRIDERVKELIIATNPSIDGETTALYIKKILEDQNILVTRIAYGLPMGGSIEYVDELTLHKAIANRTKI